MSEHTSQPGHIAFCPEYQQRLEAENETLRAAWKSAADARAQLAAIRTAWEGIAPLDMGDYYEVKSAGWNALENAITGKYEMTDEQWQAMEDAK